MTGPALAPSSVLHRIAERTRVRVAELKAREPLETVREAARRRSTVADFAAAFSGPGINMLTEIKFASPSEGLIAGQKESAGPGSRARRAVEIAGEYLSSGAQALSILTEPEFFAGDEAYLQAVRAAYPGALILQKDFVVDPYQIVRARAIGADCVLLIVALLGAATTVEFLRRAEAEGLSALVEVHDEAELAIALGAGARLVGVNNRNLKNLEVSLEVSERLLRGVSARPVATRFLSESGIRGPADVRRLRAAGFDGFLIGTHLMREASPGQALARLLADAAGTPGSGPAPGAQKKDPQ